LASLAANLHDFQSGSKPQQFQNPEFFVFINIEMFLLSKAVAQAADFSQEIPIAPTLLSFQS